MPANAIQMMHWKDVGIWDKRKGMVSPVGKEDAKYQ
jgi:hypothetical protein